MGINWKDIYLPQGAGASSDPTRLIDCASTHHILRKLVVIATFDFVGEPTTLAPHRGYPGPAVAFRAKIHLSTCHTIRIWCVCLCVCVCGGACRHSYHCVVLHRSVSCAKIDKRRILKSSVGGFAAISCFCRHPDPDWPICDKIGLLSVAQRSTTHFWPHLAGYSSHGLGPLTDQNGITPEFQTEGLQEKHAR